MQTEPTSYSTMSCQPDGLPQEPLSEPSNNLNVPSSSYISTDVPAARTELTPVIFSAPESPSDL